MKIVHLQDRPSILNHFLRDIRSVDIQGDSLRFRRNIERIGEVMALEVSRSLSYHEEKVTTPLGETEVRVVAEPIVLGTIMRAGLPFHQGFLGYFDKAENAFVSAYRRYGRNDEVEIVSEYLASPDLTGKTLILVDPMLATGMSMEVAYRALLSHGQPAHVHLCSVIASRQAIEYLEKNMPDNVDVTVWCAAIDPILNEHKYIVPGLGDAGDLCFGGKL